MLPLSLRKLAKSFKVEEKSIFPYRFVYIDNVYNNYFGLFLHLNTLII